MAYGDEVVARHLELGRAIEREAKQDLEQAQAWRGTVLGGQALSDEDRKNLKLRIMALAPRVPEILGDQVDDQVWNTTLAMLWSGDCSGTKAAITLGNLPEKWIFIYLTIVHAATHHFRASQRSTAPIEETLNRGLKPSAYAIRDHVESLSLPEDAAPVGAILRVIDALFGKTSSKVESTARVTETHWPTRQADKKTVTHLNELRCATRHDKFDYSELNDKELKKLSIKSRHLLPDFLAINLYLLFYPWKYFTIYFRHRTSPGDYYHEAGRRYFERPTSNSPKETGPESGLPNTTPLHVSPGSALDASGWSWYFLWCDWQKGEPTPTTLPGDVSAESLPRMLSLFPTFLPCGRSGEGLSDVLTTESLEKTCKRLCRPDSSPILYLAKNTSVTKTKFSTNVGSKPRTIEPPTTPDCAVPRSYIWVSFDNYLGDQARKLHHALCASRGAHNRVELHVRDANGVKGFDGAVTVAHLAAGPFAFTPAMESLSGDALRTCLVTCKIAALPASKAEHMRSWILPEQAAPLKLEPEVVSALAQRRQPGPHLPRVSPGQGYQLFVVPCSDEQSYRRLRKLVATLLGKSIQEAPWLPTLMGKGVMHLPELDRSNLRLPLLLEEQGEISVLLRCLGNIQYDFADTSFKPWERPDILIPWTLWVLVSALRGLQILQAHGKDSNKLPTLLPSRLGSEWRATAGWWRLVGLQGLLDDQSDPPTNRWRPATANKLSGWSKVMSFLARLGHDLLYFSTRRRAPWATDGDDAFSLVKDWDTSKDFPEFHWNLDPSETAETLTSLLVGDKGREIFRGDGGGYSAPVDPFAWFDRSQEWQRRLGAAVSGGTSGSSMQEAIRNLVHTLRISHEPAQAGKADIGRFVQALETAFNSVLRIVETNYLAAWEALGDAASLGDVERFERIKDYITEMTKLGPMWTSVSIGHHTGPDGNPFADKVTALAETMEAGDWLNGLQGLSDLLESDSPGCAQCVRYEMSYECHASWAISCPCTLPVRELVYRIQPEWDEDDSERLVYHCLQELSKLALASPDQRDT